MTIVSMTTKRLSDVCQIQMGQSPPSIDYNESGVGLPFFQGKKEFGERSPVASTWCSKPIRVAEPNDILVSVRAPVGTVNIADQRCCIGRGLASIRFPGDFRYLYYYLQSMQQHLDSLGTGTTFKAINRNIIEQLEIPLPQTTDLQTSIVSKIEYLFAEIDTALNLLKSVQFALTSYKQSILNAAIRGKLVPQDPNDEPASVLLERIRDEKKALIAAGKLKKEKPLAPITADEIPFELPEGWEWVRLSEISEVIDPQPSHRTPPSIQGGIPYIGLGDIMGEHINFTNARKVSPAVLSEQRARYSLKEKDILFGKIGTLGQPTFLYPPFNYTLSANVILIQPNHAVILPEYLHIYLSSPVITSLLATTQRSTSQPAYGIMKIRLVPIPLPPKIEQQRIIDFAQEMQRNLSNEAIDSIKMTAIRLKQCILKQAFEGRLI